MKNRVRFSIVTAAALASPMIGAVGASAFAPNVDGIDVGEDGVLTLTKDVSACLEVEEKDNFQLDLGTYTLTAANDTCGPIHVNGGTLSIYGNGTIQNTADSVNPLISNEKGNLTIQSGNFVSLNTTGSRYTPVVNTHQGTTNINGGTFTQNGGYNVVTGNGSGSTIITGGEFNNKVADWSGTIGNLENAGATIQIDGGTFTPGASDKWAVVNFEGNKMTINGGIFNGTVGQYDTETPFISGGTFAADPTEATYWDGEGWQKVNAVVDGKVAVQGEDGKWTVTDKPDDPTPDDPTPEDEPLVEDYDIVVDEDGHMIAYVEVEFEDAVEGATAIKADNKELTDAIKALDKDLKLVFDIAAIDKDGAIVDVNDNEITVRIAVGKESLGDEFENFQIVYLKDGKIVEFIDIDEKEYYEQEGMYYISFTTSHLSDYGILASNDAFASAADRNAALAASTAGTPDTGRYSGSQSAGVAGAVAVAVLVGVVTSLFTARKMREINRHKVQFDSHK